MKDSGKILFSKSDLCIVGLLHKILFVLVLTTFVSCSNEPREDIRPADQRSFVSKVRVFRDQANSVALTDPNRPVMLDDAVKKLKLYITDSLQSQFKAWDVRVLDNTTTDPNGTEIRITFGISLDGFDLEETARYKSIVLIEWLSDSQPPLRDKLKGLNVGDHVRITGSFVTRDKRIDIDPYNEKEFKQSKNIFANPEFRVDVTDLIVADD